MKKRLNAAGNRVPPEERRLLQWYERLLEEGKRLDALKEELTR